MPELLGRRCGVGLPLVHPAQRTIESLPFGDQSPVGLDERPFRAPFAFEQLAFGFGGAPDLLRDVLRRVDVHCAHRSVHHVAGAAVWYAPDLSDASGTEHIPTEGDRMAHDGATEPAAAIAAIDLGSNSIKMSVARRGAGGVEEFAWDLETVRLGKGLDETGSLAADRMDAALTTLSRFADQARRLGAVRVVAVATEAVRSAANGEEFLARVRESTGIEVATIGGDREAELTFAGLDAGIDRAGTIVVADIGGASTEVIVARDGAVERSRSLPIGSGRYTDRFVVADPPTAAELAACRAAARETISAEPALDRLPVGDDVRLVLVGGTGEYVGVLAERTGGLSAGGIDRVLADLETVPAEQLAVRLGIAEARARVLPAGAAIAAAVADLTSPGTVVAARSGIRRGLLLEAFGAAEAAGEPPLGR